MTTYRLRVLMEFDLLCIRQLGHVRALARQYLDLRRDSRGSNREHARARHGIPGSSSEGGAGRVTARARDLHLEIAVA